MSGEVQGPGRRKNLGAFLAFCTGGFGPLTKGIMEEQGKVILLVGTFLRKCLPDTEASILSHTQVSEQGLRDREQKTELALNRLSD